MANRKIVVVKITEVGESSKPSSAAPQKSSTKDIPKPSIFADLEDGNYYLNGKIEPLFDGALEDFPPLLGPPEVEHAETSNSGPNVMGIFEEMEKSNDDDSSLMYELERSLLSEDYGGFTHKQDLATFIEKNGFMEGGKETVVTDELIEALGTMASNETAPNPNLHTCESCPMQFRTRKGLHMHKESHVKKDVVCVKCTEIFESNFDLNNHRKLNTCKKFACKFCAFRSANMEEIRGHYLICKSIPKDMEGYKFL